MMEIKKPKATKAQKRIKILLINNDVTFTDVAQIRGVSQQAINYRLLRQDEEYFRSAVEEILEERGDK